MSERYVLLFLSFWFSTFFFSMSITDSLLCFECLSLIDKFLATLLCILCSFELSKKIILKLLEKEKTSEK
jgi:hypothetical protein